MRRLSFALIGALLFACAEPDEAARWTEPPDGDEEVLGEATLPLLGSPLLPFSAGTRVRISQAFNSGFTHNQRLANSVDFSVGRHTHVVAVAPGRVTHVRQDCPDNAGVNCSTNRRASCDCNDGYGNEVVIDHGGGWYSAYLHLEPNTVRVRVGDDVCAGLHIANSGHTGFGTNAHLHFHFQNLPGHIAGTANGTTRWFDRFVEGVPRTGVTLTSQNPEVADCRPPAWWCGPINDLHRQGILDDDCNAARLSDRFDRARFATALGRALRFDTTVAWNRCPNPFDDVPIGAWYGRHVVTGSGLLRGDANPVWSSADRRFRPQDPINRCEAVKALVEAFAVGAQRANLVVPDRAQIPAWCLPYVERAVAAGLLQNRADTGFDPAGTTSLGAGASMIDAAVDRYGRAAPPRDAFSAACGGAAGGGACPHPPGDIDYCRDCGPCPAGAGDCDGAAECQAGLVCASDVGARYGYNATYDVCEGPVGGAGGCAEGTVRLRGGANNREGRVEVCHNNVWGTVCDDGWGAADARVTCRQLGFVGGEAFSQARFGQGSGQIWLDDVACGGAEARLSSCGHNGWGVHNCTHPEDASVRCQ